jgi:hypothetical protein
MIEYPPKAARTNLGKIVARIRRNHEPHHPDPLPQREPAIVDIDEWQSLEEPGDGTDAAHLRERISAGEPPTPLDRLVDSRCVARDETARRRPPILYTVDNAGHTVTVYRSG